jgi:hypothetical protein
MDQAAKDYLNKIPREKKIDQLVEDVDSWDTDSLLDFAQNILRERYEGLVDSDLDEEYYINRDYLVDDELVAFEADVASRAVEAKQQAVCQCPSLFIMGHEDGCPDKRN